MLIVDLIQNPAFHTCDFRYDRRIVDECNFKDVLWFHDGSDKTECVPFCQYPDYLGLEYDLVRALRQIPIYLVDRSLTGRSIDVGYFGRRETVKVPYDKYQALPLENVSTVKIMKNEEVIDEYVPAVNVTDNDGEYVVNDMLGCYRRTFMPTDKDYYPLEATKPEIFIWLDKIEEYVDKRSERLEVRAINGRKHALTTLVILHELSHALMDSYLFGCPDKNVVNMDLYGQKQYSLFYELKEEGLANAMALKLIEGHVIPENWNFLVDFVQAQPLQYTLGYNYYEIYDRSMSIDWLKKKVNKEFDHLVAKAWIRYVTGERELSLECLKGLDALFELYGDKK